MLDIGTKKEGVACPLPAVSKAKVNRVRIGTFQRNLGLVAPVLIFLSFAPVLIWRGHQTWFLGLGVPASLLAAVSAILGDPRLAFLCSCLVGLQGASAQILLVARALRADNLFVALTYVIACAERGGGGDNPERGGDGKAKGSETPCAGSKAK